MHLLPKGFSPVQSYLLPLVFVFMPVFGTSFNKTDITRELRIGLMLPKFPLVSLLPETTQRPMYPFFLQMVQPAVEIALQEVKATTLPFHQVSVVSNDTLCNVNTAQIVVVDHYFQYYVDVLLGPACEFSAAPAGRFTAHWNVPMITAGGNAQGFDQFTSMTRHGSPYTKLGTMVLDFTNKFSWSSISLMVHEESGDYNDYSFLCGAIYFEMFRIALNVSYVTFNQNRPVDFETMLKERVSPKARVVFICASSDTVRQIMIEAHNMNMTAGDYAFFSVNPFDSKYFGDPSWYRQSDSDETNKQAREAYRALMTIQLYSEKSEHYDQFAAKVKEKALAEFGYDFDANGEQVNSFVTAFHDAVILYALALNESLTEGANPRNGTDLSHRMWNRTFKGIAGDVTIDSNGDRDSDYSLKEMNADGEFEVVGIFSGATKAFTMLKGKTIDWPGDTVPLDTPKCGFDGSGCIEDVNNNGMKFGMIAMAVILVLFVIIIVYVYRKYTYEKELANTSWKVKWNDITFSSKVTRRFGGSRMSLVSNDSGQSICGHNQQIFTVTGYYKGNVVAIKKLERDRIDLTRQVLMEMKVMREIQHDHVTKFVGCCGDAPNISILTEYCPKGSLQDILENDSIELDEMFKFSLLYDLVKGMHYIHSSMIRSHGNLKSSNCVVDNRFVLKVTDFGLNTVRQPDHPLDKETEDSYRYYHKRLWTAPELLRLPEIPSGGTPKGDVYSLGIIIQEIMLREGVFYFGEMDLSPEEIIQKVRQGTTPPFRPVVTRDQMPEEVMDMMNKCWAEDPPMRPDFSHIRTSVRKLNKGRETGNLVDNLLSRMEQYASNLEDLVEERTEAFYEEKKKAEELLYQILPKPVAEELKKGKPVTAETFEIVTIYFSDIVGFTKLSSQSTPLQVVDLLNDLYTAFDAVIDNFNVYKVETIGDAYMVVSGLPIRNGDYHAREIARMSLALLQRIKTFRIRHRSEERLKLRIGIHSGPAVAGVVGLKMPRYCLFGDTVNTASRMESNGEALKIHVSSSTKKILDLFGTFVLEKRGEIEMKGKGVQTTYWLQGELKDQNGICDFKYQEITV
ncbi:atrial natriuretic peptide receptor 1-like isoform X6 [Apostichopus japonicus]|uniref:atrial natriuretic peptide receptor 1-like isoform X6 n=1 Tax=Stichopus japonicus TaxID=307972 RepID=UPI003AB4501D